MKKFRTVLLNGYQKNEVDAYINEITGELEREREENARGKEQSSRLSEELKNAQDRVQQLEKECSRLKEAGVQQAEAEKKLQKYEKDYSDFMDLMVNMKAQARQVVKESQTNAEQILGLAKKEADGMIAEARSQAEELLSQAREETRSHRESVEKELEEKKESEIAKFQTASFRLAGYLDALNRSQSKLIQVYEELGRLVGQLPIKNSDVFSAEAVDFLEETKPGESSAETAGTEVHTAEEDTEQ